MAMKKAEMEIQYNEYQNIMVKARYFVKQGLFAEALKRAFQALERVDGTVQYVLKYQVHESSKIEAIEYVLKYDEISKITDDLGQRYLKENVKWVGSKLPTNNYVNSKEKLIKVIELCRGIGFEIPSEDEQQLLNDLKGEYEFDVHMMISSNDAPSLVPKQAYSGRL